VRAEQENSELADEENIELSVSNSSCSSTVDVRRFDGHYHSFKLVISARLNVVAARRAAFRSLLSAAGHRHCDARCQLKSTVSTIVNQSRPVIDR